VPVELVEGAQIDAAVSLAADLVQADAADVTLQRASISVTRIWM
jgi:hypothetical protein